jgi:HEAT repeat protein
VLESIVAEAGRGFDELRRQAALDALQRIADAPVCAQALRQVADGTAAWLESSRFLMSVGASIVPALVRTRVGVVDPEAAERLEAIVSAYGKEGRDALRRLLNTPDPDLRIAAMRMLGHTKTTEHLPSLEGMLTDAHSGVRQEALRTLVGAESSRGQEILARGMARADEAGQMALLDQVVSLGAARAVPALHHLLTRLDQRTAAPEVYVAIIAALRRAGTPEAVAAIEEVFRRTQWTVPLRAMRFRSAARTAIDAIGGDAGTAALRRVSVFGRLKPARPVTDRTAPQGKVDAS